MSTIIGFPRKCRGTELSEFAENVRREVDESLDFLSRHGRDLMDVAVALGVHRKTLTRWRTGETDVPAKAIPALRNLVSEFSKKAAAR